MSDVDDRLAAIEGMTNQTLAGIRQLQRERDEARAERDRALDLCERARATARRFEEELALIRRAAAARRHG